MWNKELSVPFTLNCDTIKHVIKGDLWIPLYVKVLRTFKQEIGRFDFLIIFIFPFVNSYIKKIFLGFILEWTQAQTLSYTILTYLETPKFNPTSQWYFNLITFYLGSTLTVLLRVENGQASFQMDSWNTVDKVQSNRITKKITIVK